MIYEYRFLYSSATNLEDTVKELNELAAQGWRAVGVIEGMIILLERERKK